jgi:hypothetical protein
MFAPPPRPPSLQRITAGLTVTSANPECLCLRQGSLREKLGIVIRSTVHNHRYPPARYVKTFWVRRDRVRAMIH